MIAYLEDDGAHSRVGLVTDDAVRWIEGPSKAIGGCLALAGFDEDRPTAVVAALSGADLGITWSGVRALTAAGNALAFAWNVPAAAIDRPSGADEEEVIATVRRAAAHADADDVLVATYDGVPNITTPKS